MGALRRMSRTAKLRSQRAAESSDAAASVKVADNGSVRATSSPDRMQAQQDREASEGTDTGV